MQSLTTITATTALEALTAASAPIATIAAFNSATANALLVKMLNDVVDYLNVGKSMTAPQIVETVKLILGDKEIKNFKPEDFKVCFDGMKRGKYGKFFDRIDGQIFFECLYQYGIERSEMAENESKRKHEELKAEERKQTIHPKILPLLKSAIREIPKEDKNVLKTVSPKDERVKEIFAEFDSIWSKNHVAGIGRFIKYNGKEVNQIEYLEIKLKELNK